MSQWTAFRVVIDCLDQPDALSQLLGEPMTAEVINKLLVQYPDEDALDEAYEQAVARCHLPMGSEGSISYAVFPVGSWSVLVLVGNLRDYAPETGQAWVEELLTKLTGPHVVLADILET